MLIYKNVKTLNVDFLKKDYNLFTSSVIARDIPNCYVLINSLNESIVSINNFTDFNNILTSVSNSSTKTYKDQIIKRFIWYLVWYENKNFEYLILDEQRFDSLEEQIQKSIIYNTQFSDSSHFLLADRLIQIDVTKKNEGKYYNETLKVQFDEHGYITSVKYE
jgi:hypothetical protein